MGLLNYMHETKASAAPAGEQGCRLQSRLSSGSQIVPNDDPL
jgi:hypothetical protein